MIRRKQLNKLVVTTLKKSGFEPTASQIYCMIKRDHPCILRKERVPTFRSFVKVLGYFSQVEAVGKCSGGTGLKVYVLKKI